MAGLLDELITTLDDELKIYRDLLPLADGKAAVIIKNDVAALERITGEEEKTVEKIAALERKRSGIMKNMRIVLNRERSELKLPELIGLLSGQPESQKKLLELKDELKETLDRLKTINDRNNKLIKESLEINEFQLNIFRSTRSYYGNNYTRSAGQYAGDILSTGSFDRKQ